MSYDVCVRMNVCPHCGHGDQESEHFNYTYNVSEMFYEAFGGEPGLRVLNGMRGHEAALALGSAILYFMQHPELSRFNAKNGWGDYAVALKFLESIRAACVRNTDCTVEV